MATITVNPSGYQNLSGMSASSSYPITNSYTNSSSTSYTRYSISTRTTGTVYYTFDISGVSANATINSVNCVAKVRVSSTSRVTNTICQLYSGTTAKGSNSTFNSTSSSNTETLNTTGWTRSELDNLRLRISGTGSSSSQSKYIYFYGANLTIDYTESVQETNFVRVKQGGSWHTIPATNAHVKVNNAWHNVTKIYVKENGVWKETE